MNKNSNKNWSLIICLVLAIGTFIIYYQAHSFEFVNYDDNIYVYANPNIQAGIIFKAVKWAFTAGYADNWHPLTWLSHMLDWRLFGANAGGHHIVNLIFHIANTLLLFFVLRKMTNAIWPSAFVAALFVLHPLHVESVAWVSERKDVLSTFFWLLTMWAYVRFVSRPKISSYLWMVIFFALGLMAKPMLVTLPFVLLLLDYWPLDRLGPANNPNSRKTGAKYSLSYLLIEKIPLFVLALASCIVTFIVQKKGGAIHSGENYNVFIRLANASVSYLQYIIKMIWPSRLAFFYPHPGSSISVPYAVISAVLLLAVTIIILRFAKNHRYLVTGWFWYLGTLVPVIGLVQVGIQAFADRYSYITLIGLFVIIAWGLAELFEKWAHRRIVLWTASLMVLSTLAVCTYFQTRYWQDSITLYQHALKVTENNCRAHLSLAKAMLKQNRIKEAIQHNNEVLKIKPDDTEAINNLGLDFDKAGKTDEAIGYYKKAIEVDPCDVEAYLNLGSVFIDKGEFGNAVSFFSKALQISPDSLEIRFNLGLALVNSGKFEEAVKIYEEVLRNQPRSAFAHNDFGILLFRQGKFDDAIAHLNQAIRIDPDYAIARDNLNIVLAEKQKFQNKNTKNIKK